MRTGNYIAQLKGEMQYQAFIPNDLPLSFSIDIELQSLLSKADQALGRLDTIGEVVPDVDFFILMYVRKEATLSSQIEGTQATFVDVLKAEAKIEDAEVHKDVDEILNYINALNYGLKRLTDLPLSLRLIKEIHERLLKDVRGEWKTPGEFRNSQNWVGGSSIQNATYVPPPHTEVIRLMGNLENYMYEISLMPILIKTGIIHAHFETIHPFLDGNGRVGRLLMPFYLCQQNVLSKPLLYLSEFFKLHRQVYYDKLNAYREKDDIEGWLKFYLEGVTVTADKAVQVARNIMKLREINTQKVISLGRSAEKGEKLLNLLYKRPLITIKGVEKSVGLENPNALKLVSKFEKLGILKEITGKSRNRIFSYQDYIQLFS
ncbi:Fic family protein [Candidatus Roizmanbacteria bacterium]|nr:Fic family protein [Candidatus Roizmanbacteria bacterium]